MNKHTPGPWRWVTYNDDDFFALLNRNDVKICDFGDIGHPGSHPVSEDRLLIAAAPKMYEYISRKAQAGDAEAMEILGGINANS